MKYPTLTFNESVLSFTEGITATSAQHLCNIAKEKYAEIETRHANLQFYNEKLQSLSGSPVTLSQGILEEGLEVLKNDIIVLSNLKTFIAYLKEAIAYKESIYSRYNNMTWNNLYHSEYAKSIPIYPAKKTLGDLVSELPIADRYKYLSLETQCAVIGGFVHPNGGLSKARKKLIDKKNNPAYLEQTSTENIIHQFTPSVNSEKVDELFFDLQQKHRHVQAEFNKFKSDLENKEKIRFSEALSHYNLCEKEYHSKMMQLTRDFELEQLEVLKKIQSLKIIIPNSLVSTYKELSSK